jgi:fructokinase
VTAPDLDVLSFGEALVDFFPERPGPSLVDVDRFQRHLGGAPANVAVGLARCGRRVGLMTLVGPDDFGRYVRRALGAEGIDLAALGTHASAKTGITFVAVAPGGERSFLFFRHPSADQMIAETDVDPAQVARARIFHVGSSTLSREPARAATLKALQLAVDGGRLVSSDPNWRPHLWEDRGAALPLLRKVISCCDIVKVADDELDPIVGVADPVAGAQALRALGARLAVVTLGARGCWFDGPGGRGAVPGEQVEAIDTTGAGDGFVAGLLAALTPHFAAGATVADLDEPLLRDACVHANHLGACAVTALGATTAIPRAELPAIA